MSEAKNGEPETKATSLAEAVVAALATQDPPKTETKVDGDEPVVSAVTIGTAIAVGAPGKSDDPEVSVAPASEAEAASVSSAVQSEAEASAAKPAEAPTAEPSKVEPEPSKVETEPPKAKLEDTKPAIEAPAGPLGNDELTAPRGLPVSRELPDGIGIRYFGRTDVGLVREHNEDNFLVVDVTQARRGIEEKPIDATLGNKGIVLAVCDGMGGAAAGEVASQMAVDTIHEMMTAGGPPKDRDHFARRLVRAVEEAGSRIFSAAKLDRSRRGMGTTSTVAGLVDHTLFVGQVGDSRAYVLRGDQFALITKDQSLVNQLIEAGQLTEEEAEAFEHSNIILQALGTTEEVTVDLTFLELRRGDRLLMCSDGLSGLVHADMMKDVLRASRDLPEAAAQLIAMANAGGGHDNITVIVAEFDGTALKEPDGSKVAYQQYPLPPATADTIDPPPPRPASLKPSPAKPGADVKTVASLPPEASGGMGRWWVVAVLVLLVLALLGAIFLSMDPAVATTPAPTTRTTLSSASPPPPALPTEGPPTEGRVRFGAELVGATLEVDGTAIGPITTGATPLRAGAHHVAALRDGHTVASADVTVAPGREQLVELERTALPEGVEPPPVPVGVVEPEPSSPEAEAPQHVATVGGTDMAAESAAGDDGFVRRTGDLPHEPPPRPATP
ncbi:MAG: Stp1/IreP family PP2C-type Ser/Thr phosphatase [Sandaracinus sp.]